VTTPLETLRSYPEHELTLDSTLASRVAAGPERPFLRYEGQSWSWGEFATEVDRAAAVLEEGGVTAGDRVVVLGPNTAWHVILMFACSRLRATMAPLNPVYRGEELRYLLANAEPVAAIVAAEALDALREAAAAAGCEPWLATLDEPAGTTPSFASLAAAADPAAGAALARAAAPDDTAVIVYTSGTTGFPKGVMHSQQTWLLSGEAFVERQHLTPEDHVLAVLPLFHINALFYSVAGALAAGCGLTIVPRFSASTFWDTAVESGATQVNVIDAVARILEARPRSEYRPEHRIRKSFGVQEPLVATLSGEFGLTDLIDGFGMTEVPGTLSMPFGEPRRAGSMGLVGRHPDPERPRAECRVVDDDGADLPAGEIGELLVRTPLIMQGYFHDPEQTAAAFREGGWFASGDLVRREADGYFYFHSRKKDIIRRRGENISGAEIDRVVRAHPGVLDVAAIPAPAAIGEEEVLVVVVPAPGAQPSAEEIAAWCAERLAPMKVPRYVLFTDDLPYTATHKVAKAKLREDETLVGRAVDLAAPPRQARSSTQRKNQIDP
jgi:crotonobetaine/carnitine-CoA ligase